MTKNHDGKLLTLNRNLKARNTRRLPEAAPDLFSASDVLKHFPIGIAFLDSEKRFQQVNPALADLFECNECDLLNACALSFCVDASEYTRIVREVSVQLNRGHPYKTECRLRRMSGKTFIASLQAQAVESDNFKHGTIWIIQDISDQKRQEDKLRHQASRDPLTGAYNRREFSSLLNQELCSAQRYHRSFALMILDVDHFKAINDAAGHQVGDEVLVLMTKQITEQLREVDLIARWGGEEFMILLPATDREGAERLAERIRNHIASTAFGNVGRVTVSIGIASFAGEATAEDLIKRADEALYMAKRSGRNRIWHHQTTTEITVA